VLCGLLSLYLHALTESAVHDDCNKFWFGLGCDSAIPALVLIDIIADWWKDEQKSSPRDDGTTPV